MTDEAFDDKYNAYYKFQYSPQYGGKQKPHKFEPKADKSGVSQEYVAKTFKRWILAFVIFLLTITVIPLVIQILERQG